MLFDGDAGQPERDSLELPSVSALVGSATVARLLQDSTENRELDDALFPPQPSEAEASDTVKTINLLDLDAVESPSTPSTSSPCSQSASWTNSSWESCWDKFRLEPALAEIMGPMDVAASPAAVDCSHLHQDTCRHANAHSHDHADVSAVGSSSAPPSSRRMPDSELHIGVSSASGSQAVAPPVELADETMQQNSIGQSRDIQDPSDPPVCSSSEHSTHRRLNAGGAPQVGGRRQRPTLDEWGGAGLGDVMKEGQSLCRARSSAPGEANAAEPRISKFRAQDLSAWGGSLDEVLSNAKGRRANTTCQDDEAAMDNMHEDAAFALKARNAVVSAKAAAARAKAAVAKSMAAPGTRRGGQLPKQVKSRAPTCPRRERSVKAFIQSVEKYKAELTKESGVHGDEEAAQALRDLVMSMCGENEVFLLEAKLRQQEEMRKHEEEVQKVREELAARERVLLQEETRLEAQRAELNRGVDLLAQAAGKITDVEQDAHEVKKRAKKRAEENIKNAEQRAEEARRLAEQAAYEVQQQAVEDIRNAEERAEEARRIAKRDADRAKRKAAAEVRDARERLKSKVPLYWGPPPEGFKQCVVRRAEDAEFAALSAAILPGGDLGGKDQRVGGRYRSFECACAWRIENRNLFEKFCAEKQRMKTSLAALGCKPHRVRIRSEFWAATSQLPGTLDADINEVYLAHGTKPETLLSILHGGLNERFSGGLFGQGSYFAEDVGKNDQYVTPDYHYGCHSDLHKELYAATRHPGHIFYVFFCRVALGHIARTIDGSTDMDSRTQLWAGERGRELAAIRGTSPPEPHHALLAELGGSIHRYREFIVFHGDRIYPEYLVAYRRV